MPPQETNLTFEAGDDAPGLCREPAIALRRDEAARRPAASMRNVLSLLKGCWRAFRERRERERLRVNLHELSDRELNDIGLTRGEIDYMAAHRTIERLRDGTMYR